MPKDLWRKVAKESNRYFQQTLTARYTKEWFLHREIKKPDIQTHEFLHVLGLLMARMLNQHRRRFRDHWRTTVKGAVPRGTFSDFMARHRFERIMANLRFTNNAYFRATTDRACKVRSVIATLQQIFPTSYKTPPVISFDEGILPSRNRSNPTRQYLKAKPHKWGTKMFLTCCAATAYCTRKMQTHVLLGTVVFAIIEVYCGKAQQTMEVGNVPENQQSVDPNTGPAAVIRNLEAVLPTHRMMYFT
ncbi:Hypothetical protein PHPALM_6823 [Phytophthora palmivora]|uniref:PiggyBac transposable element-derived protein domain-containing protein n=1 Tax=Phytophthora palmivora TaxID=4796 RepID=A0A2P4YE71_9STRA|nr:Hypothetical protein PHPALM_6823 [Phytophthora palmivora]